MRDQPRDEACDRRRCDDEKQRGTQDCCDLRHASPIMLSKRRVGKGGPGVSISAPTWGPPLPTLRQPPIGPSANRVGKAEWTPCHRGNASAALLTPHQP